MRPVAPISTACRTIAAGCRYDPKRKTGPDACPFNYLYWAFLIDHADTLAGNHRLAMPYRTIARWGPERCQAISREAHAPSSTACRPAMA